MNRVKPINIDLNDDEYAMKLIKKGILDTKERLREKVHNETNNIIDHKNICKLYGYFVSSSDLTYYMIFELCEKSLYYYAYLTQKENQMPFKKRVNILIQCTEAIKALHDNDILHLDIKLENFLLNNQQVVKLIDFGFSHKIIPGVPKIVKAPKGTLDYMSPEMLQHDNEIILTKETDCWAFGVLIYDFINGRAPFANDFIEDTRINIREINWDKDIDPYLYPLLENIFVLDISKRWDIHSISDYLVEIYADIP